MTPRCRYCNGPIRKYTRTNWIERERRPHMKDTSFSHHIICDEPPADIAACRKLTNDMVVSVRRYQGGSIRSFGTWDGVSYIDPYFCSNKHAQKFAYAFAKLGYRMTGPSK